MQVFREILYRLGRLQSRLLLKLESLLSLTAISGHSHVHVSGSASLLV